MRKGTGQALTEVLNRVTFALNYFFFSAVLCMITH